MSDLLIRNVPEQTVRRIDQMARRMELSRNDFLRRQIERVAGLDQTEAQPIDWDQFSRTFTDLADPAVMEQAWR